MGKEINHIDASELYDMLKSVNIKVIDIREPFEHEHVTIKGTINIPMDNLINDHSNHLEKDEVYYLLCHHGVRSRQMAHYLMNLGYSVVNILGGWDNMKQLKEKRVG